MVTFIIGTTPTITYTFSIVDPNDFTEAVLTLAVRNTIKIEKTLEDATVGDGTVSWTLTQEETLALGATSGSMMVNWLTSTGVRGASDVTIFNTKRNHISEVME